MDANEFVRQIPAFSSKNHPERIKAFGWFLHTHGGRDRFGAAEIRGEMLLVFGALDPHIPEEGRVKIQRALEQAGTKFNVSLYTAEHAFMRDEGPRYDAEASDQAWAEAIAFYRRAFGINR